MCGIAGFIGTAWSGAGVPAVLQAMTDAIAHRGPDDAGCWTDAESGVALGHRRLAIIDLSAAGHQPMHSASGRYVLIYNGEIYNHRDLRSELEGLGAAPPWRGHSDTEVMLAGFEHWGIRGTLERLIGMFAFAVWDRRERVLTLARDRMGEKPLYFGRHGATFLFGSELKALTAHPAFERAVNRDALALLLRYNCIPAPHTIWQGMSKLLPAHYVEVRDGGRTVGHPQAYWDFTAIARAGAEDPLPDAPERIDELEALLKDAIGRQMQTDVPLGAFLSGGIDSSLIVSLMQAQAARPVRTFTIGFNEDGYNEAVHAREVARHLGTDHTEWYVGAREAQDIVPRLATMYDEPFADSSQIPTHLVSALTRRHVTVSLSGDGGDELFGGYNRYALGLKFQRLGKRLGPVRPLAAAFIRSRAGIGSVSAAMRLLPASRRHLHIADRLPKVAHALEADTAESLYRRLVSHFEEPEKIVIGGSEPAPVHGTAGFSDVRHDMMHRDSLTYLPDDILTKVDRASMAVSLESRVPFLDHRVVEYAWRLPISAKFRNGRGKHILREILYRHVPRTLVDRPKAGFGLPVAEWLTTDLRDWTEDLLDPRRLAQEGFFRPEPIRALWDEQLRGGKVQAKLWDVLMAQAWLAEHVSAPPAAALGACPEPIVAVG